MWVLKGKQGVGQRVGEPFLFYEFDYLSYERLHLQLFISRCWQEEESALNRSCFYMPGYPCNLIFRASGDRRTLTTPLRPQAVLYQATKRNCINSIMPYRRGIPIATFSCPKSINHRCYCSRDCFMSSTAMGFLRPGRRLPTSLISTPIIDDISNRSCASTRRFSQTRLMRATVDLDALNASKGNRERIVILGSGWAGGLTVQGGIPRLTNSTQASSSPDVSLLNTRPSSYPLVPTSSLLPSLVPRQPVPSSFGPP